MASYRRTWVVDNAIVEGTGRRRPLVCSQAASPGADVLPSSKS